MSQSVKLKTQAGSRVSGSSGSAVRAPHQTCPLMRLPVELHVQILRLVDPDDVLSYARTCKLFQKYAENQQLWKHQWIKLSNKTPFTFLPVSSLADLGINFKDACRRLWKILVTEGSFGGLNPTKCVYCREFTCSAACIEERSSTPKVTIDIGGKITWLITPSFSLQSHLSMMAIPKLLKCFDCDEIIHRSEYKCDCSPDPADLNPPSLRSGGPGRSPYCRSRVVSSHTALEYCSQHLSDINVQPILSQPFCLFCEEEKVNRLLCERDMVTDTKHKMKGVRPPFMTSSSSSAGGVCTSEEDFANYNAIVAPLTNGYCRDTATILGADNLDLLSPLLALEHEEALPIAKAYLSHLMKQHKMINDLQRPNSSLILTTGKMPMAVREAIIKFFFEEVKVARFCLLPKGLAIAQLFEVSTCIVVDSGALSTSVWVVVDGKVDESKTQTINVGGWHVSQFLKQALTWKDNKDAVGATVSSLDTRDVKQKCRLSLNLAREGVADYRFSAAAAAAAASSSSGACGGPRMETLHIKSQRGCQRRLESTEVTLSSELYLAPEMMYASLDLPAMVQEATKDLPDHLIKDCFSNILITGGNTDLQGFVQRFSSDLRELMPEHAMIINVCPYRTGNHSWNTVMGAHAVKIAAPYGSLLEPFSTGSPIWLIREEYILFGTQLLAAPDPSDMEG